MVNNTRHLRLPRLRIHFSRKVIVFTLIGILLISFISLGIWQIIQNNQYHQSVTQYSNGIKQLLDGSKTNIEGFLAKSETSNTASAMTDLAAALEKKTQQSPAEPRLFGLQLGTHADYTKQTGIVAKSKQYASDLRQAAAYITYQNSVIGTLMPLTTKSSTNLDQLNELLSGWSGASEAIKEITPPDSAKNAHAALVTKIEGVLAVIARMPELYKKVDIAQFDAAKKDLSAAVDALHGVAAQFTEVAKAYDAALVGDRAKF